MASFQVTGFISAITYKQEFCFVFVNEYKKGYVRKDGFRVDDKYLSWKCIFNKNYIKYISGHFGKGMLVEIKGEVLPFAIDHENMVDGYSVNAQTINIASYPRASVREELKMIKESQERTQEKPNIEEFIKEDFQ